MTANREETRNVYFDWDSRRLVIQEGTPLSDLRLIHEITHALQEQHFGIAGKMKEARTSDQSLALEAVVEGSAIVVEEAARAEGFVDTPPPAVGKECLPPDALYDILMFGPTWGYRFFREIPDGAPAVFQRLPQRSREILHPSDYLEAAAAPGLRDARLERPASREDRISDSLGEFILRSILKNFVPLSTAILGAKGLTSDRVIADDDVSTVRWTLRFESTGDVEEAVTAFQAYTHGRFGIRIAPAARSWSVRAAPEALFTVTAEGHEVEVTFRRL